jgi:hypothetical protein
MERIINRSSSPSKATPPALLIASSKGRAATSRSGSALSLRQGGAVREILEALFSGQSGLHTFDARAASGRFAIEAARP